MCVRQVGGGVMCVCQVGGEGYLKTKCYSFSHHKKTTHPASHHNEKKMIFHFFEISLSSGTVVTTTFVGMGANSLVALAVIIIHLTHPLPCSAQMPIEPYGHAPPQPQGQPIQQQNIPSQQQKIPAQRSNVPPKPPQRPAPPSPPELKYLNENLSGEDHQAPVNEMDLPESEYKKFHKGLPHLEAQSRSDSDDNEEGIVHEWDVHMANFVPDMLVTFNLASRSDEYFYHDVSMEQEMIRGGFFVTATDEASELDFTIMDPESRIIMKKKDHEALFHFDCEMMGTYTFILSNRKWLESKLVTFAIGAGNETALTGEEVSSATVNARHINRMLQDIQSESQVLWSRTRSHMRSVTSMHRRMYWLALFQFIALISITAFQVYFIKHLVSHKRMM
eukprot:GHVN01051601.1.p1 GENE.GHVN01051601.1~~GHVN01051601.1.p1  ORF type:complete len:391 (-),score=64.15 GHVN01051601.1:2545-3717(-)